MGTPIISLTRDKAIAETNAIIVCDNAVCNLDATHTTASLILLRDVITTGRFSGDIFFMT